MQAKTIFVPRRPRIVSKVNSFIKKLGSVFKRKQMYHAANTFLIFTLQQGAQVFVKIILERVRKNTPLFSELLVDVEPKIRLNRPAQMR